MKNIVFISHVKTPEMQCSSTDIMTLNLIEGLSKCDVNVKLILAANDLDDRESISKYYSKFNCNVFFVKRFFSEGQSKYKSLFGSLFAVVCKKEYIVELNKIYDEIGSLDIIISNKVTIDEIIYGEIIKKRNQEALFYQYWSDPMALSGINRELFLRMPRRWLFRFLESAAIKNADRIIYGTKVLGITQATFFKKYKSKMKYIDVCYSSINALSLEDNKEMVYTDRVLYAGNFFKKLRDISPLVEAIETQNSLMLDVYGTGDVDFSNCKNVRFCGKVSREVMCEIEKKYSMVFAIMNKKTPQIPGKLFYDMASRKQIVVLSDGPMQEEIITYLKKYRRFAICKNRVKDIRELLHTQMDIVPNIDYAKACFSPSAIAQQLLSGGLDL